MLYDKLHTQAYYFVYDNFKSKNASIIINTINGARTNQVMKFDGYGTVTFNEDDKQKINPHVTVQDKFNRFSTAALVFSIDNEFCPYDKVFIFNHILPVKDKIMVGSYSLVFYNTKNGLTSNIRAIPLNIEQLVKTIQTTALRVEYGPCYKEWLLDKYENKYK